MNMDMNVNVDVDVDMNVDVASDKYSNMLKVSLITWRVVAHDASSRGVWVIAHPH